MAKASLPRDVPAVLERHILPNGVEVLFDPEEHKYYVDGKEVPSVTTVLQSRFGNSYAAVRPEILEASARYGTNVHNQIEHFIDLRKKDPNVEIVSEYDEVKNYFEFVEPIYKITPIMTEKVVVLYDHNGEVFAAGRFDMLCTVDGKMTLVDFKTTSTLKKQLVAAQLNLYLTGLLHSGYVKDISDINLGAIHLYGSKSVYVPMIKFPKEYYLGYAF